MSAAPKCTWNPDLGWLTPEHRADCKDECRGCRPCPKTHCALFGRCANHVDVEAGIVTCPGCVGKVRNNLRTIEERMTELDEEAETKGVDSEALNLAGPANIGVPLIASPYDRHHPLLVLGRWDMMIREDYNQPTSLLLTISRARDHLDSQLTRIANDDGQDFELLAKEIAGCLTHLETVLGDSRTPEQGVACPTCRTLAVEHPRRLVKRYATHDETGQSDRWVCPRDSDHWWSEEDYRKRIGAAYLVYADKLTADQIHQAHGVAAGTIRRWASVTRKVVDGELIETPPLIKAVGKSQDGRNLYSVEAVLALKTENQPPETVQVA